MRKTLEYFSKRYAKSPFKKCKIDYNSSFYFFQKSGVNTSSKVNNSKRPSSIATLKTQRPPSGIKAKLWEGPTPTNPGPTHPIVVSTAEKAVNKSKPKSVIIKVKIPSKI